MKTIKYYSKLILIYFSLIAPISFAGCEDEVIEDASTDGTEIEGEDENESTYEPVPFSLGEYNPTSGGKETELHLYGTGFGKDINNVTVTVNSTEAEVTEVDGYYIKAKVAAKSGTGAVKVRIGEEELTYDTPFTYNYGTTVSTWFGKKIEDQNEKKYGTLEEARLWKPMSIAFDNKGTLYIVQDKDNYDIAMVKDGKVSQFLNGLEYAKTCKYMFNIAFSKDYDYMYISNNYANEASDGSNIVSIPWDNNGSKYDVSKLSVFWDRTDITKDVRCVTVHPITGEIFAVHGGEESKIYRFDKTQNKMVDTGTILPNKDGDAVRYLNSRCILFSKDGNTVYISGYNCGVIYKGDYNQTTGEFSNLNIWVGKYNEAGWQEGKGTEAKLNQPFQMDIDDEGNLYVAVQKAHRIAKITPDGVVTNYAGTGTSGTSDGTPEEAQFNHPSGLQFGPDGVLYVSDYWNHMIRKIETE